jgi:hypothetical protein
VPLNVMAFYHASCNKLTLDIGQAQRQGEWRDLCFLLGRYFFIHSRYIASIGKSSTGSTTHRVTMNPVLQQFRRVHICHAHILFQK